MAHWNYDDPMLNQINSAGCCTDSTRPVRNGNAGYSPWQGVNCTFYRLGSTRIARQITSREACLPAAGQQRLSAKPRSTQICVISVSGERWDGASSGDSSLTVTDDPRTSFECRIPLLPMAWQLKDYWTLSSATESVHSVLPKMIEDEALARVPGIWHLLTRTNKTRR